MAQQQLTFEDESEEYRQFVWKFKRQKTTDDCYTPENIYGAVADWVAREYGLDRSRFVRPFWPGADYRAADYPEGCVVVDNPPFSILTQVCKWYNSRGIPFFLFAPSKTAFCGGNVNAVCVGIDITFENGAVVNIGFATSLGDMRARSAPDLYRILKEEDRKNRQRKPMAKLAFPDAVITALRLSYLSAHGVEFGFVREDAVFIRRIDDHSQGIFGGGYLLTEEKEAERAAADRLAYERSEADRLARSKFQLSERERAIQRTLRGRK